MRYSWLECIGYNLAFLTLLMVSYERGAHPVTWAGSDLGRLQWKFLILADGDWSTHLSASRIAIGKEDGVISLTRERSFAVALTDKTSASHPGKTAHLPLTGPIIIYWPMTHPLTPSAGRGAKWLAGLAVCGEAAVLPRDRTKTVLQPQV